MLLPLLLCCCFVTCGTILNVNNLCVFECVWYAKHVFVHLSNGTKVLQYTFVNWAFYIFFETETPVHIWILKLADLRNSMYLLYHFPSRYRITGVTDRHHHSLTCTCPRYLSSRLPLCIGSNVLPFTPSLCVPFFCLLSSVCLLLMHPNNLTFTLIFFSTVSMFQLGFLLLNQKSWLKKKASGEENSLFGLHFYILVWYWMKSGQALKLSMILKPRDDAESIVAYCLLTYSTGLAQYAFL